MPILSKLQIRGDFNLDSNVSLSKNKIKELDLLLNSKNFMIPPQNINNFELPSLNLGKLSLKAQIKKRDTLEIKNFCNWKKWFPNSCKNNW